jgi:hypothetical protein
VTLTLEDGGYSDTSVGFANIAGLVAVDNGADGYNGCAGVTVDLVAGDGGVPNADKPTYDLSQGGTYNAISFWAVMTGSAPATLTVQLPTTGVDCATDGCWGANVAVSSTWTQYTVQFLNADGGSPLSDLWYNTPPAFDPTQVVAVQWQVSGSSTGFPDGGDVFDDGGYPTDDYNVAIDQLELISQ